MQLIGSGQVGSKDKLATSVKNQGCIGIYSLNIYMLFFLLHTIELTHLSSMLSVN